MNGILISIVLILVIAILAGYVLNSLGPTIFKTKQVVEQIGKDVEKQNKKTEKENLLNKIKTSRDLSGLNFAGLDLRGYDFSGKNLDNTSWGQFKESRTVQMIDGIYKGAADIRGADFSNTDLRTIKLFTNCHNCDFSGANLSGMTFDKSSFMYSDFTNANLSGTKFNFAFFERNDFTNANLSNLEFNSCNMYSGSKFHISWNDFTNANLNGMEIKCSRVGYNYGTDYDKNQKSIFN
jgi:uncharacterized protein YjbI with pentapeptide repeats